MLDAAILEQTSEHLRFFMPELFDEVPLHITRRSLADDGTPSWSADFSQWFYRDGNKRIIDELPGGRYRLKRSMRQLRKVAPREHDVVWRVLRGESVEQIAQWLNERAIRGGHPERYSLKDATVLVVSGVDKIALWY